MLITRKRCLVACCDRTVSMPDAGCVTTLSIVCDLALILLLISLLMPQSGYVVLRVTLKEYRLISELHECSQEELQYEQEESRVIQEYKNLPKPEGTNGNGASELDI